MPQRGGERSMGIYFIVSAGCPECFFFKRKGSRFFYAHWPKASKQKRSDTYVFNANPKYNATPVIFPNKLLFFYK